MSDIMHDIGAANTIFDLLKEGKFTEAHTHISQGGFNTNATNENGTSLLLLSLINEQYRIAETLIRMGSDINTENHSGQFCLSARAGSLKGFKRNLQLMDKFGVMPALTFERFATLIDVHTNRNTPANQLNQIKLIFERFADTIATFDPMAVQEVLSHSENKAALSYYQETLKNNSSDLQDNRAFGFLKQVIDKVESYFDYYTIEREEDRAKIQRLEDILGQIREGMSQIHTHYDFERFFQILPPENTEPNTVYHFNTLCESMLAEIYPGEDTTNANNWQHSDYLKNPVVEMLNVYRAICSAQRGDIENNYTDYILAHWSHPYFERKVNINHFSIEAQAKEDNINLAEILRPTLDIYGLNSILLTKDLDLTQGITDLNDYLEEVLTLFPMDRHLVGNDELNVVIHHTHLGYDKSRPTDGLYQNDIHTVSVNAHQIKRKCTRTFLHEYTHYMQGRPFQNYEDYQAFFSEPVIDKTTHEENEEHVEQTVFPQHAHELQPSVINQYQPSFTETMPVLFEHAIKSYEEFSLNDLAGYFSRYVVCSFGEEHEETIKKLGEAITPVLAQWANHSLPDLKEQLNLVMVPVLNEHFKADCLKADNFVYDYLDTYQTFTQQKEFSFDYLLWSKLDQAYNRPYWTQTVEIHARMNEALALDKIGVAHNLVSPMKFEKIKAMIHSFNQCLVEKALASKKNRMH